MNKCLICHPDGGNSTKPQDDFVDPWLSVLEHVVRSKDVPAIHEVRVCSTHRDAELRTAADQLEQKLNSTVAVPSQRFAVHASQGQSDHLLPNVQNIAADNT